MIEVDERIVDAEGRRAVEVCTVSGTDTGGFMGLPPTGKGFRSLAVFIYAVRDGRIPGFRSVYDFTGILVQTGMLKAKPV